MDNKQSNMTEEPMPPMTEDLPPPATPREISKHHKIHKNGVGFLLADVFKAKSKPGKFPTGGKSEAKPK